MCVAGESLSHSLRSRCVGAFLGVWRSSRDRGARVLSRAQRLSEKPRLGDGGLRRRREKDIEESMIIEERMGFRGVDCEVGCA